MKKSENNYAVMKSAECSETYSAGGLFKRGSRNSSWQKCSLRYDLRNVELTK